MEDFKDTVSQFLIPRQMILIAWVFCPYLLWRRADKNWRTLQAVDKYRNKSLQKRRVYWTRYVVLEIVAQLSSCFYSDLDIYGGGG
jgi:hypothetical protein